MVPTITRTPERVVPSVTREDLARTYNVSQGYLGYLLREKRVPLPVRFNGDTLWYADEVEASVAKIRQFLERRNKN